jgi:hypothetical protein
MREITGHIYEPSLLKAFNNNQTFKYTKTNSCFNSSMVTKLDDKNISIDLDMCNIENKSWWQ